MADRTLEVVLKLTTGQFQAGAQGARQAVAGLSQAMAQAIQRGADPLGARLTAAASATNAYRAAMRAGAKRAGYGPITDTDSNPRRYR